MVGAKGADLLRIAMSVYLFYFMYVGVACMYLCGPCTRLVPMEDQKRVLEPLRTPVTVMRCPVGAGIRTLVLWKTSRCSYLLSLLSVQLQIPAFSFTTRN